MDPVTEITEEQTPRGAWTVTTLLFLYLLVNFADKAVVGLAAVPIMRELDLSPKQFGLVGSSFSFLFSLSAILVGFVANRVAVRWVLLALAFSWAVVQFPMVGAAGLATLVVCRVLLGAGEGPAFSMAVHALYEWFPDQQRTLPTAVLTQGAAFGVIVALPALNWIIVHYSWHWAFFALGVVGLLWVVAWLLLWPKRSHCRTGASGCGRVSRVSTQTRALPAAAAESDLHRLLPSVLRSNVGTRPRAHVVHSFHHNWPRLLAGECGLGLGTAMDNGRGGRSDDGLCIADLDGAWGLAPRGTRRARLRPPRRWRIDHPHHAACRRSGVASRVDRGRWRSYRIDLCCLSADYQRVHAGGAARRGYRYLCGDPHVRRHFCADRDRQRNRDSGDLIRRLLCRLHNHCVGSAIWRVCWPAPAQARLSEGRRLSKLDC